MPNDSSLQALREMNPRSQPGFDQWIGRFGALAEQIPATPPPAQRRRPTARRRRLLSLSAAGAAVSLAATAAGLALSAAAPESAYAAARKAVTATETAGSGTMTTTVTHNSTTVSLGITRWHGHDIATSSIRSHLALLLTGGTLYVQQANGTWLRYPDASDAGPKLGPAVESAEASVRGNSAGQVLALATGLHQVKQPDGATVYTGIIPDSSADPAIKATDDATLATIASLRSGNEPGAPGGSHPDLTLRLTTGRDGRLQQVSLTFQQHDSGEPGGDGTYTWNVTYGELGSTAPITAPATSDPA